MRTEPSELIFEKSRPGRQACGLPSCDVPEKPLSALLPDTLLRDTPPALPEVSEVDVVRHFVSLSHKNLAVDTTFYPLGSCTMKYNPKVNEAAAALPGFARSHPCQPVEVSQGVLSVIYHLERYLAEIAGLDAVSLQPSAGAHGELTSLMAICAYHEDRGERRTAVLIPDSAHGTNPASCTLCGLRTAQVRSDERGMADLDHLRESLSPEVAAVMITNPNTLGLFDSNIAEVAALAHEQGALLYMDGANMNAIMGLTRPGDFGVVVMHFILHKTFSTPHGGGGPGAGPIAVRDCLEPYLPVPRVVLHDGRFALDCDRPKSIGKVRSFHGSVGVLVKAYCYIRSLGPEGVREAAEDAILNANYLLSQIREHYDVPYGDRCMHEFVAAAKRQKKRGVKALDIAKRLIDLGFHPPTVYFPLIVPEAMMIEPTETESRETLDAFASAMAQIAEEAEVSPDTITSAPQSTPVSRLDEVKAARELDLRWRPSEANEQD